MNKLSILFTDDGFSYIAERKKNRISEIIEIKGNSKLDFIEKVKFYFNNREIFNEFYDEVKVVFNTLKYTFVPYEVFDESMAKEYLSIQFPIFKNEPIRYNIDFDLKSVLIFSYLEDLEFFLESKFKNIMYFHSIYSFIKNINKRNLKEEYHINFYPTYFEFIGFENSKFQVATTFEYTSKEDVLYHICNYFINNNKKLDEISLFIYGNTLKMNKKISLLKEYFYSVEESSKNNFERAYINLLDNQLI